MSIGKTHHNPAYCIEDFDGGHLGIRLSGFGLRCINATWLTTHARAAA